MLARVELHDEDLALTVYLAIDRLSDGWCAGGLRFAPSVTPAQLERLARLMTLKFGALGVRIGGAKAGIVGPRQGPAGDRMLLRAGELLEPLLRSWYMTGEDLGTRGEDITRIYAHIGLDPIAIVRQRMAAGGVTFTAPPSLRPADLFSDQFAGRVAGDGVVAAALAAAEARGLRSESLDVSLQGFGTVGLSAARGFQSRGFRLVAVADSEGCVCAPRGLDIDDLARARNPWGVIDRRRLRHTVTHLRREDWCRVPADVLVPAAVEDAIGPEEARRVHAKVKLIVEAANGPVALEAETFLEGRGIAVVPDFVASAGSAAAFGLLMTGQAATPDQAAAESSRRIASITRQVLEGPEAGARQRAIALASRTFADPVAGRVA